MTDVLDEVKSASPLGRLNNNMLRDIPENVLAEAVRTKLNAGGEGGGDASGGVYHAFLSSTYNKVRLGIDGETFNDVASTRFFAADDAEDGEVVLSGTLNGAIRLIFSHNPKPVSYTHLRAHETGRNLVCRLLLEKKKK